MNDEIKDDDTEAEYEVEQGLDKDLGTDLDTDLDIELDTEEEAAPKHSKFGYKLGSKFMLGGFALSILLGGALGVIGSKIFAGPDKTIPLRAEFQQSLDELRQSTQSQTKLLGSTADNIQKKSTSRLDTLQTESQALANQIRTMQQIIAKQQSGAVADLKILTDRIDILEALSGENADVFTGADSIVTRLNALEESTLAQVADEALAKLTIETDTEEITTKNVTDMSRISSKPPVGPEGDVQQTVLESLIDTFPRAKMLAAVKAQEQVASKKTGWLKRALSKHVRVGNDNAPDPYVIIDTAETALKNGQITASLEQLAQLNPPVRASASEWIRTAKKAAPNIE